MLKILVIEDHALVRDGLVQLLQQLDDEVVILEAADGEAGVQAMEANDDIDLVMLDLALPGVDGLSWLKIQRMRFPAVPIVVCSAYDDGMTVRKTMRAGASGFVPKAHSSDRLLAALQQVLAGGVSHPGVVPSYTQGLDLPETATDTEVAISGMSGRTRPKDFGLSPRQVEVLHLIVKGKTNREIAQLLGLTEGTVKIHVTAVFRALGVKCRTQAVASATRHKMNIE